MKVDFPEPVPLTAAVLELVIRAGRDPKTVFAVLDLHYAELMNCPQPASRMERLVILFDDWSFMHVQLDQASPTRQ